MTEIYPALDCNSFGNVVSVQVDALLIPLLIGNLQWLAFASVYTGDPEDAICTALVFQQLLDALAEVSV